MPYDRNTRSYWSQMRMDRVHGLYIREKVTSIPILMKDNVGNIYNVFGKITEGPDKGKKLEIPRSFWAKDWAWEAFYPDSRVISATTK